MGSLLWLRRRLAKQGRDKGGVNGELEIEEVLGESDIEFAVGWVRQIAGEAAVGGGRLKKE